MPADYRATAQWLKDRLPRLPKAGVILGTGLNQMAEDFPVLFRLPYAEIPGFVSSTAPSHLGNLILAEVGGTAVIFLQGRFHYYEGYPMEQVVFPTRVLACLGVKTLVVTNASGSLKKELEPGNIVLITDHINFMGINPLRGHNDDELGERFPSLNQLYEPAYQKQIEAIAARHSIPVQHGTYIAVGGPSLETKAECAAFAGWGADLVGMSTAPEVIAARHAGMKVLGISIVTNYSNLFHDLAHYQAEIQEQAALAGKRLQTILTEFLSALDGQ